ncbi:carbohydrate esterase family 4 protein [Botryobasidium botryosum FD-172 SS1]|uniref:chitin deacetylase n=1 Tax=Botryobasidium botryosum (strain FD-172 SS1) TaxID=930990 RepID=A0A067LX87_BOTB1|nr:carbohydrate esterase family 4 protein [Botryobasidium botryosum FD-172 SS1]
MARAGSALLLLATFGAVAVSAGNWHHPRGHPVHDLFKRQNATGGFPAVGSAAWTAAYPSNINTTTVPAAWMTAYTNAKNAGLIPNLAPTTLVNGNPTYATGVDPMSATVCSSTDQCRINGTTTQIWDAPDGMIGVAFDDGPLPPSTILYPFLKQNNQPATHFFIGENIWQNPTIFQECLDDPLQDIAVHTWTHPYMTTKTDEELLLELGLTIQIIHDSTNGRVPKFWRPPYGDSDVRVVAIAYYVFHLTTVIWNQDSNDWQIGDTVDATGVYTDASVTANLTNWLNGPKSPGLLILEHELTNDTVNCFINTYPLHASNGWISKSIPDVFNQPWYQNSQNNTAPMVALDVAGTPPSAVPSPPAPAPTTTAAAVGVSASAGASGSSKSSSNNSKNGAGSIAAISTATLLGAALCSLMFW